MLSLYPRLLEVCVLKAMKVFVSVLLIVIGGFSVYNVLFSLGIGCLKVSVVFSLMPVVVNALKESALV